MRCFAIQRRIISSLRPQAEGVGVGRVGAGRIDLTNANNANVVAFNGSDANQMGVSFGVVETPVNGTSSLTKNITVEEPGNDQRHLQSQHRK